MVWPPHRAASHSLPTRSATCYLLPCHPPSEALAWRKCSDLDGFLGPDADQIASRSRPFEGEAGWCGWLQVRNAGRVVRPLRGPGVQSLGRPSCDRGDSRRGVVPLPAARRPPQLSGVSNRKSQLRSWVLVWGGRVCTSRFLTAVKTPSMPPPSVLIASCRMQCPCDPTPHLQNPCHVHHAAPLQPNPPPSRHPPEPLALGTAHAVPLPAARPAPFATPTRTACSATDPPTPHHKSPCPLHRPVHRPCMQCPASRSHAPVAPP